MKVIGNIISDYKRKIGGELFSNFNCIDEVDNSLPTLIVGFQKAKEYISDFNILNKKYTIDGRVVFWTFKKNERKYDYDKDLKNFYDFCIENLMKSVEYHYMNVTNLTFTSLKKLVSYIKNKNKKYIFVNNERFVFIYDNVLHKTIGVSLSLLEYVNCDKHKILNYIFANPNNIRIKRLTDSELFYRLMFNENLYLIPYIEYYFKYS